MREPVARLNIRCYERKANLHHCRASDHLLSSRGRFRSGDVGFDFLYQVSHIVGVSFRIHRRASSAASLARTLASYTWLPTRMRIPPMSRGLTSNDVSSP